MDKVWGINVSNLCVLENLPSTHKRHKIILSNLPTLKYVSQSDMAISVRIRNTFNYQNNYRNTFGWLVG